MPEHDAFAGLTAGLVMAGIPAVVSMRSRVSDSSAVAFNEAFYKSLGRGRPLERATLDGRLAIRAGRRLSSEWSLPVLTTDAEDGRLFKLPSPPDQEARTRRSGRSARPSAKHDTRSFTWLHLPDLYLCEASEPEIERAFCDLFDDLEQQLDTSPRPAAVFVTGICLPATGDSAVDQLHMRLQRRSA